jgi:hypothetical protein
MPRKKSAKVSESSGASETRDRIDFERLLLTPNAQCHIQSDLLMHRFVHWNQGFEAKLTELLEGGQGDNATSVLRIYLLRLIESREWLKHWLNLLVYEQADEKVSLLLTGISALKASYLRDVHTAYTYLSMIDCVPLHAVEQAKMETASLLVRIDSKGICFDPARYGRQLYQWSKRLDESYRLLDRLLSLEIINEGEHDLSVEATTPSTVVVVRQARKRDPRIDDKRKDLLTLRKQYLKWQVKQRAKTGRERLSPKDWFEAFDHDWTEDARDLYRTYSSKIPDFDRKGRSIDGAKKLTKLLDLARKYAQ